jgi:hypothetical protein
MTDWERIIGEIQRAMEALDSAHAVGENLRENPTPDTVDAFKERLSALYQELDTIKYIWEHEFDFSIDELSDVLSQMASGQPAAYRHSPRYKR